MYHCPINGRQGWYIGPDIRCLHNDESAVAWAATPDETSILPPLAGWHVPAWSKAPVDDVQVTPLVSFLEGEIAKLSGDIEDMEMFHGTSSSARSNGKGKADDDKGKGGKGNKQKGKDRKPSGWMERSCPLIAAILDGDTVEAQQLAETLSVRPDMVAELERHRSRLRQRQY